MALGRHWVAAVALVMVAGGCADDEPQPEFEPSAESTATTSDASSPDPAPKPWEKKTEAGAVAFAKHWVAVLSKAMRSSDTHALRSISKSRCKTCAAFADRLDSIKANGGFYRTPGWKVMQSVAVFGSDSDRAEVALRVFQGRETYRDRAGQPIQSNSASRASYSATVLWDDGGWSMREFALVPS